MIYVDLMGMWSDFNLFDWIVFFVLIFYTLLWFGGASFLRDPEKRFPRIQAFDEFYLSEYGFVFLFIRNLVVWLVLFVCFIMIRS